MEEELGVKYHLDGENHKLARNSVGVVKYADDFVVVCKTKKEAINIYEKIKIYLDKRGLALADDKTKITHISDGFYFLGFNLRQYKINTGMRLLIKPSKASVKKARETIKNVFIQLRGKPVGDLIQKLNPIIRGIGNYWSTQVAKKMFAKLDSYIWIKIRKHLKTLHPKKPFKWIYGKYFKEDYTGASKDKWILTNPHNTKMQLFKMTWIPIVRHVVVRFKNSPDNATLKEYFEKRDKKEFIKDNVLSRGKLAKSSNYKCRVCRQSLVGEEPLKINQIVPLKLGGYEIYDNLELLHQSCRQNYAILLKKYGGGIELPKIATFFKDNKVEPNSKIGYQLIKKKFKKFKYQFV